MWLNIAGFIFSLIFYVSMHVGVSKSHVPPYNPLQDSLISAHSALRTELRQLRDQQGIILNIISRREKLLSSQEKDIREKQDRIHTAIKNDWDSISPMKKEQYTRSLIRKLKTAKK